MIKIKKMPTKKMLEEFLRGLFSNSKVIFNIKKGKFEKAK